MKSKTTTDHQEIMGWVNDRGGNPSIVKDTKKGDSGILRIDFPGYQGEGQLEEISWDDFFGVFDAQGLQFLYQEKTADGEDSRFNKLISGDDGSNGESAEEADTNGSSKGED